jgi:hypothetical protein
MTTLLRNLLVGEVSLVDKGANKKRFYLMKAADNKIDTDQAGADKPEPTAIEKALSGAVDGEAADADPTKDLSVALRRIAKASGLDEAGLKTLLGIKDPEPTVVEKVVEKIVEVAKAADEPKDPLADLSPEAKAKIDVLFKAQADAVAKAAELTKALEDERESKAVGESIQKAAADFKHLPEKAEALGPALRTLRKSDAKAVEVIENVLKRADALVAQALDPKGAPATATEDAGASTYERVEKRAHALVAKGEVKTVADGVAKIFAAEPKLYAAHEAEKKG